MPAPPCPGPIRRREFLRLGTLALGGLGLSDLLAARAGSGGGDPDTSVILFWMWGGPSQFETWDPKPDAPLEIRGPFRPIPTDVPGMDLCELFPRQARLGDRIALVRSLHHSMSAHNDGSIELLTGKTPTRPDPTSTALSEHPDFGMVASRVRGHRPDGMPRYVGIPRQPFMTRPTYLGVSHGAFGTGDPSAEDFRPPALTLAGGLDGSRLEDRKSLKSQFDRMRRGLEAGADEVASPFHDSAFQMLTNPTVASAFDLSREDDRLRDRYGRHLWGQACLLARRLAESGSTVITIDALAPTLSDRYFSWDDHINVQTRWDLADAMRYRAPFMDQALSALIEDVYARGLDRKVMIVAAGEFGRTPRLVRADGLIGRDHWPDAMTALLSGGGLRTGQVVGSTNRRGEYPEDRPLTPQDLLATIYRHLGIDPRSEFVDRTGRPLPILPHGEPIRELC
ncbi:DUF1501 domain-containing protein [Tautonia plasticadhaerens]|uniref:DUF1501 domain-containing protein n=1 Tax=Tautonia plasticadhaerens TaxID=2527974 RepID=A0A518GVG6_9BACT|nr:DUF1501 domain-containing protein [Tautonia plasticadhaerens]QDV32587.1 hypothetical protein ElP_04220 [Tautonia plasticadhaerens]